MEEQIKIRKEKKSVPERARFASEGSVSKGFKMAIRASQMVSLMFVVNKAQNTVKFRK